MCHVQIDVPSGAINPNRNKQVAHYLMGEGRQVHQIKGSAQCLIINGRHTSWEHAAKSHRSRGWLKCDYSIKEKEDCF